MKNHVITATLALTIGMSAPLVAHAQSAADQLQEYRAMLADGNPAELYEMEGEELWVKAMGPKTHRSKNVIWVLGLVWSKGPPLSCRATSLIRTKSKTLSHD